MDTIYLADKSAYAVKHRNEAVRMASRSGGVFTALSDKILEQGGVVYGVKLDENFDAVHARADTKEKRDAFRGSKYVQSKIGSAYTDCETDLKEGLAVLFSGTPCQIDGLKSYIKAKNIAAEKLITLEIICHGVPSPRVYKDYLDYARKGRVITSFDFRNKSKYGWTSHVETIKTETGDIDSQVYANLFLGHNTLRPSCFCCPYKKPDRYADITIGDYWGIDELDNNFNDNRGVSLVLLNNDKGEELFGKVSDKLYIEKFHYSNSMQPVLRENFKIPSSRLKFWKEYESMPFSYIAKKYGVNRRKAIKAVIKKLLGRG